MKEFKDVYRILCRSVLPCLSIQAAMRNFYIWCQIHSQALHRENQPRHLTNQGQFIQEWTGGYSLLQGNLARNLFPTITLNHIITLCHHASFLTLRNEKNMDEGLTIYLFIHCKSPWHILRMGFGVWDQCRENHFSL